MRMANKNKQNLYYALRNSSSVGTVGRTITIDGVTVNVEDGYSDYGYSVPEAFIANIIEGGGNAKPTSYGISLADYDAVLVLAKDQIPISEDSLIWHNTVPAFKDAPTNSIVDPDSADYRVKRIIHSLNHTIVGLARRDK